MEKFTAIVNLVAKEQVDVTSGNIIAAIKILLLMLKRPIQRLMLLVCCILPWAYYFGLFKIEVPFREPMIINYAS